MRAVVHHRYGPPDVLRIEDVPRPVPHDDQVLIRVRATTVNRTDTGLRAGDPFVARFLTGLRRPAQPILGTELSGEVAEIGSAVHEFTAGDHVFGINAWNIGKAPRTEAFGAHAEYICMRESGPLAHMPRDTSFEDAAAVCDGAMLSLQWLRPAAIKPGQRVLVYGASGSIGTAAVQLAKNLYQAHVTAVCPTKTFDLLTSLGADQLIDYTQQDFTRNGQTYDVIFDAVGKQTFSRCRRSLNAGGAYLASDRLQNIVLAPLTSRIGSKRVIFPIPPRYTKEDVILLKELIEAGKYRAVIDRRYALEQVVEASRYVETKQKIGNVVLIVS